MGDGKEAGMRDLLKKDKECRKLRGSLEDAAAVSPDAVSLEEFLEGLPFAQRAHAAACGNCRETATELFAARKIFQGVASRAEEAGPWFANRVMAAIAEREPELALRVSLWNAVPRFASRLVLASAIVVVAASTWLYEKPGSAPPKQASMGAAPEYLFEMNPPPANDDEALVSLAQKE
jgi:hypothetical protein